MSKSPFNVAIVGGGIAGLTLAIGLMKRNIDVTIYEKASKFAEIGAGVAFSPNAVRSMEYLDKSVSEGFAKVATGNADPELASVYFKWVLDGFHSKDKGAEAATATDDEEFCFLLDATSEGVTDCCHRAHFLDEMIKLIPEGMAHFHKGLVDVEDRGDAEKLLLKFSDGTTAEADAVIGCDGIKSQLRVVMHGASNPASHPHYSHKYAIRGLVPMEKAVAALGAAKAQNAHMHMGPDAHMLTFAVSKGKTMNVVGFITDPNDWPDYTHLIKPSKKEELVGAYKGWSKSIQTIIGLLDDNLDKWAIFDLHDHPLEFYAKGRMVLSGDAAHATTPHHGAGAGMCIEDAAVMCGILERTSALLAGQDAISQADKSKYLSTAFAVFDDSRRERTQWLVRSSRITGDIYEWRYPETGNDLEKCHQELKRRFDEIWYGDEKRFISEAVTDLEKRLAAK